MTTDPVSHMEIFSSACERVAAHGPEWVVVRSSDGRAIRHYYAGIDAIEEARRLNAWVQGGRVGRFVSVGHETANAR